MAFIIYGAWSEGKKVLDRIRLYKNDIIGFLDTYQCEGEYEGYPVFKITDIKKETPIILAHPNIIIATDMYKRLHKFGFYNLYWYMYLAEDEVGNDFCKEECLSTHNWGDCVLPNMEIHVADNCNLNCRGCTHFSPLFHSLGASIEERLEDIRKVRSKFTNIGRLDILGGEPFLNVELDRFIVSVRSMLPDTHLNIFTNGLLIPKAKDKLLRVICKNSVSITVSEYPPTKKIIGQIKSRLKEFGIRYRVTPFREGFNLPLSINRNNKHPRLCISSGCVSVRDGKIARCPTLLYVYKFNEIFGQRLPNEGIYDLNDCPSGDELLSLLEQNVPLCNYCIRHDIDWTVCSAEKNISDFALED